MNIAINLKKIYDTIWHGKALAAIIKDTLIAGKIKEEKTENQSRNPLQRGIVTPRLRV